jgi:MSHA biogenesis protein MshM
MYRQHFNLREIPFALTPDISFLFRHGGYQAALNVLLVALAGGEGFIKITGEVGTGKTLLCRRFLETLDKPYLSAYVPNPLLAPGELYRAVADELSAPIPATCDVHETLRRLDDRLLELGAAGRRVGLCIDEAQTMSDRTLEALRLLSNLETEKRKLLHIVLFGQPELDRRLAGYGLRQLRQRIAFAYRLPSLDCRDTADYVRHRLRAAGARDEALFTRGALRRLWYASRGIPRLINVLAHKALLAAFGRGERTIRTRHVRAAVRDTPDARRGWMCWRWPGIGRRIG